MTGHTKFDDLNHKPTPEQLDHARVEQQGADHAKTCPRCGATLKQQLVKPSQGKRKGAKAQRALSSGTVYRRCPTPGCPHKEPG